MPIKLYDFPLSQNARKVRLLAAELDLPLERQQLDPRKGENRSPAYLAKNPNAKVPTVEDDGFVVWESAAIAKYLAAKRPERGLLPSDPRGLAAVDQWLFWNAGQLEPALGLLLTERVVKPMFMKLPGNDPSLCAEGEALLKRYLPVLEAQLAGKEYVLGALSVVDFVMAPGLELAPRCGLDLAAYPNITAWLGRLAARPYWKDA